MADKPLYLQEQETTEEAIRQRMLDSLPSDLDKAEGSYIWDAVNPPAIELALAAILAREVLRKGFATTAASTVSGEVTQELTDRAKEHGLTRKPAEKAIGQVTFTGSNGTVIPAGTRVATPASSDTSSIEFETKAEVTIGATGNITADIIAVEAGANGNVPSGAISILVTPVPGVTGVTNVSATSHGLDIEDDISLLGRYLQKVQNPSAGGNRADYITWAGEVAGVGGVSVVPVKYGNGTVSVSIIDINKQPAGQDLVDAVLEYIAAPWEHDVEAETMTVGGSGTSIEASQDDDSGSSVKMEYNAAGEGTITHANIHTILDKPGIWQARLKAKASDISGANDLLRVGIWNTTTGAWAKVSSDAGAADAVTVYQANDLTLVLGYLTQQFYWNGTDNLELRITRLQADTTTVVWVDLVKYRSLFSKDTGDGKSPVGAAVYVEPAKAIQINISAALTIMAGYDPATVKATAETACDNYLKGIAFKDVNTPGKETENDVKYARIANAILDTEGVEDYQNLLVNGGTANIPIGAQEVAVKGTVTFT